MQNRISTVQVVDEALCVRYRCQRLVGVFLRVWNTDAVRPAHRLLVVEVELQVILARVVHLKLEAVADAFQDWCERVVFCLHVVPQVTFCVECLEFEVRVFELVVSRLAITIDEIKEVFDRPRLTLLLIDQLLQVLLHHNSALVVGLLAYYRDDWTFNARHLETKLLDALLRHEEHRPERVLLDYVVAAGQIVERLVGVRTILEKLLVVIVHSAPLLSAPVISVPVQPEH